MEVEAIIQKSKKFEPLYNLPPKTHTVVCIGGRGGGKTYEISKFIAFSATMLKKRCVIIRDEKALIKDTILNEIWARYDTANEKGALSRFFTKNETELKDKKTGKTLIYTKGFRASDNQKRANLKGASDIDIAVIEEGEDITDVDKFNTFVDSLRKEGCLVIIILNTPDTGHFILKRYFNLVAVPAHDGYFEPVPKEISGVVSICSVYQDNEYLPDHVVNRYESYGNPDDPNYNVHYYLTAIKGYSSSGRKGQVLKKVKPIKFADYMKLPYREYYGQDFGIASPAALVGVKFDKNRCWWRLINYKPMSALELAKLYCTLGFTPADRIIADNADAKAIMKLKHGFKLHEVSADDAAKYPGILKGFYVVPCVKGADAISQRIALMDGMELYCVEEHAEAWHEINNYIYAQDKYGNYTNDPEDAYNHHIDAVGYVVNDQRGKKRFEITTQ